MIGAWFDGDRANAHDIAAWIIAVREVSSMPLQAEWAVGDGGSACATRVEDLDSAAVMQVKEAAELMRAAGLWIKQ